MDNYSNFVEVKYLSNCPTSQDCAEVLKEFVRQGSASPERIVCDKSTQFESAIFEQAAAGMKAKLIFVGAYAHWAAAKIERWHRVLNERVRAAIYAYVKARQASKIELSRQYHGQVSVVVDPEVVGDMVEKVVERWNACPRAATGLSPHDILRRYKPWVNHEIKQYRPDVRETSSGVETQLKLASLKNRHYPRLEILDGTHQRS